MFEQALARALQGVKAEVRTYNTIINVCNRSGQPENALKVYKRMLTDGVEPTATTYTALISAYGKTGKVRLDGYTPPFRLALPLRCGCACERVGAWLPCEYP